MTQHKQENHLSPCEQRSQPKTLMSIQGRPNVGPQTSRTLIESKDAALVLLNHQTGLMQTVKDISIAELRANTTMLAGLATSMNLPVITTESVPDGPNGPLMPEIPQSAPHMFYVQQHGGFNAWDNDMFIEAVRRSGKKTLIMAGVWTSVCVMFPALEAKAAGFKVYAVTDASGDISEMTSRTSLARLSQAGVIPTTASALSCELQRLGTWPQGSEIKKCQSIVQQKRVQANQPAGEGTSVLAWHAARLRY